MKITLIIALLFCIKISNAQEMTRELRQKLTGKIKFEDIKTTINKHFEAQLNVLQPKDSVARKDIMRQLKKWNRQFWISEFYTDASGVVQDKNKIDGEAFKNLPNYSLNNNNTAARQTINWINHGPTNNTKGIGRVDKIAFHPTDPNTIYAGTPHGGLFKTIDGGNSWFNTSPNLPSLGISGIAIDPTNPQIIYVLSGDANTGGGCFLGNFCLSVGELIGLSQGVFKSYDGGNSWVATGQLSVIDFRGSELVINPQNPNILLAATTDGLYRTTNGGGTWQRTKTGNIHDVKYKPNDGNIVYITGEFSNERSINGGLAFNFMSIPQLQSYRRAIAVTPANPNKVLIYGGSMFTDINGLTTYTGGVFSSSNAGLTFTPKNTTTDLFSRTDGSVGLTGTGGQYSYNICIAISPTNENIIYTGGLCVWASVDSGANWIRSSDYWLDNPNYMHPDIHELKFNPLNGALFCGNDGGVYKKNGSTWDVKYNGIDATQFYHFAAEKQLNKAWGGAQDNGISEQILVGSGAYQLTIFGDGYDVLTDHNYLVSGGTSTNHYSTVNDGIYKNGAGYDVPNNKSFFGNLALAPNDTNKLYVGYQQAVYIRNPLQLSSPVGWDSIGTISGNWCISTCRSNSNRLYAAGTGILGRRLFKMDVSTTVVSNITPPAPYNNALKITDIEVNPTNADEFWISVGGTTLNAKVFTTTNGGTNWTNISFNLPNVPIFCIKRDANNVLYAGTSIGMFAKRNGVNYWEPFSNGLPPVPITEIEIWPEPNPVNGVVLSYAPTTPEVWVSTFGRGIWYTQIYANNCDAFQNLSGAVTGTLYKEATGQINSSQSLQGGAGTNVKYNAGTYIYLTNGFFAGNGAKFQTFNTGCGNPIDLNRAAPVTNTNADDSTDNKKPIPIKEK
jgi:hypothetical protein